MTDLTEASYVCGSCGEEIVVTVDPTEGDGQVYVEDCPVCCRPHVLRVRMAPDGSAVIESSPE
jgi:DNA replicative helicase MCM subunit Mcm2 (Cdc46/Mcm family)